MNNTALYPGSFDPFTLGHKTIVDKSLEIFDTVIIAVGVNNKKSSFFSTKKRIALINKVYGDNPNVKVVTYEGLTSNFCRTNNIKYIVRGLRNIHDFEFEREIAYINNSLNNELETIFLLTPSEYVIISSSTVRELLTFGGDPMKFMPSEIDIKDLMDR